MLCDKCHVSCNKLLFTKFSKYFIVAFKCSKSKDIPHDICLKLSPFITLSVNHCARTSWLSLLVRGVSTVALRSYYGVRTLTEHISTSSLLWPEGLTVIFIYLNGVHWYEINTLLDSFNIWMTKSDIFYSNPSHVSLSWNIFSLMKFDYITLIEISAF